MALRPPAPSPLAAALERLGRLAGTTAPDRMARETAKIIAEWRADCGRGSGALRERLEALRDDLAAGLASAEEQAGGVDVSDKAAVRAADVLVSGQRAALEEVVAELGRTSA